MKTKVSVPGKVHLIGEHAVVYGEPAILTSIGRRVFVEAEKLDSDKVKISVNYDDKEKYEDETTVEEARTIGREALRLWEEGSKTGDFSKVFELGKGNKFGWVSIGYIMEKLGIDSGVSVRVDQRVPLGSGLGSSSAYSVALAMALSKLFDKDATQDTANNLGYELERFKHGKPSGGDNSACSFGGLVWFKKGDPNIIKPLKDEIQYKLENFVLVYTKKPEKTTGELVQAVRDLDEEFRNHRVKKLGELTNEMLDVLKQKDFHRMKDIINETQKHLADLDVSIAEIDEIAEAVRKLGGAAKLCGAGGGGTMLCWHEDKAKLIAAIKQLGYEPWETDLAVEGVRVE